MPEPVSYSSTTPRNAFPLLFAGQSQKETTVNEALTAIDFLLGAAVEGIVQSPPTAPTAGQCWIVGTNATGAFAGHDSALAGWTDGGWRFLPPFEGLRVHDRAASAQRVFSENWQLALAPPAPAGGATVDAEARTCLVALLEALKGAGIIS